MGQNIVEYILEYIQNPKMDDSVAQKNIFINAEGGAGKTTAMIEIYRRLLSNETKYGDQVLIPVYIPLMACSVARNKGTKERSNSIFLDYLYTKYDRKNLSVNQYQKNMIKKVLDAPNCAYRYVFMLDAINENHNWESLMTDILSLADMKNVCVIVSGRRKIRLFDAWHKLCLTGIPVDVIRKMVGRHDVDPKTEELLSIPFYMSKYMTLLNEDAELVPENINRYTLLSAYFDNLFDRQLVPNAYIRNKGELPYSDTFELSRKFLLPLMCFEIMCVHSMFFYSSDDELLSKIKSTLLKRNVGKKVVNYSCDNINKIIDDFFVSTGVFVKLDDGIYRISHEIYRDFFAAKYIMDCIKDKYEITDRQLRISRDTLDLLLYPLFGNINVIGENGEFIPGRTAAEKTEIAINAFWRRTVDNKETDADYFNFTFVYYNMLEYFRNGSPGKIEFCGSTEELLEEIFERLKQYFEINPKCKKDYEQIRLYAEVLRRISKYTDSIEVSKELAELADNNEEWRMTAEHNIAKCNIYKAFDIAKKSVGFSEEAYELYRTGIDTLRDFSDKYYTMSSNLYAMLVAYPDPVSEPYLNKFLNGEDMHSRRMKGFFLNLNAAKSAYYRDRTDNSHNYPLKQCMIAMMNKDVCFAGDADKLKNRGIVGIMNAAGSFKEYNESFYQNTLIVAEIIMKYLRANDYSFALECMYVKLMLLRGDEIGEDIRTLIHMSEDQIISIFIKSLIDEDNDDRRINRICEKLTERAEKRSPDSFDAVYIQADLKAIWENIIGRGYKYSCKYTKAVEEMLNCKL